MYETCGNSFAENKKAFGYWHKNLTELTWLSYEEVSALGRGSVLKVVQYIAYCKIFAC